MVILLYGLDKNGVCIDYDFDIPFVSPIFNREILIEDRFKFDFSKHDEQLLKTKFMTCAESDKIKCENEELKSQCEFLKEEVEKTNCEIHRLREKCGEVPCKNNDENSDDIVKILTKDKAKAISEEWKQYKNAIFPNNCEKVAKRKYDIGDVVLCHQFNVESRMVFSSAGLNLSEPYIDDSYFNRKAYISNTYKQCMEQHGEENPKDKDEYEITFLDNGNSLAWVSGDELTLLVKH